MFLYIVKWVILYLLLIFLIHKLYSFFQNNLTIKKTKDLLNYSNKEYNKINDIINSSIKNNNLETNNKSSIKNNNLEINNNSNNSLNNYNAFENNAFENNAYNINDAINDNDVKNELNDFLNKLNSN